MLVPPPHEASRIAVAITPAVTPPDTPLEWLVLTDIRLGTCRGVVMSGTAVVAQRRFQRVSTRMLIGLALVTGVLILVAFAVQVLVAI